jgi:hypothetical protein
MEKFAINLENVKKNVLFDCILMGSEVARKYKYKQFYTNDQEEPENWYEDFINDLRMAVKYIHKGEDFYVSYGISDFVYKTPDYDSICYIFFKDRVYSFDNYYADCPIFEQILKDYN